MRARLSFKKFPVRIKIKIIVTDQTLDFRKHFRFEFRLYAKACEDPTPLNTML